MQLYPISNCQISPPDPSRRRQSIPLTPLGSWVVWFCAAKLPIAEARQ